MILTLLAMTIIFNITQTPFAQGIHDGHEDVMNQGLPGYTLHLYSHHCPPPGFTGWNSSYCMGYTKGANDAYGSMKG